MRLLLCLVFEIVRATSHIVVGISVASSFVLITRTRYRARDDPCRSIVSFLSTLDIVLSSLHALLCIVAAVTMRSLADSQCRGGVSLCRCFCRRSKKDTTNKGIFSITVLDDFRRLLGMGSVIQITRIEFSLNKFGRGRSYFPHRKSYNKYGDFDPLPLGQARRPRLI
jgi:hypothetical protein